ncbi:MAG: cob(I)yrinic acid a,c-diamide adenosyltransferase, partial [Actinomycetota bacterium]
MVKLKRGLIQIYTGDGKGKTTAALGQAVRALGHEFKVGMVSFFKEP